MGKDSDSDSNSISYGDHFSLKWHGSHDPACTGQDWDQAFAQKPKDTDAPISLDGPKNKIEIDSLFDETDIIVSKNSFMTVVGDTFSDTESEVGSAEVRNGDTEYGVDNIESDMRDIETIRRPLKHKAETGK